MPITFQYYPNGIPAEIPLPTHADVASRSVKDYLNAVQKPDGSLKPITPIVLNNNSTIMHLVTSAKIAQHMGQFPRHGIPQFPFNPLEQDKAVKALFSDDSFYTCPAQRSRVLRKVLAGHFERFDNREWFNLAAWRFNLEIKEWKKNLPPYGVVNLSQELPCLVLKICARSLFDFRNSDAELDTLAYFMRSMVDPRTGYPAKAYAHIKIWGLLKADVLAQKLKWQYSSDKTPSYVREMLINNESIEGVIRNYWVCLLECQEKTSSLLLCILWMLAKDTELQDKCRKDALEIEKVFDPNAYVEALQKLDPIIGKALQLYPPKCISRTLQHDAVLRWKDQVYPIKKGEVIEYWPLSNSEEESIAFGAGVHRCPAETYIKRDVKALISKLLAMFEFRTDQMDIDFEYKEVLKPVQDLIVQIRSVEERGKDWQIPVQPENKGRNCLIQ